MTHDSSREEAQLSADNLKILAHVSDRGPQTAQDLIDARLVTTSDDAEAAMDQLVEANKAHWIVVGGQQCLKAGR